VLAHMPSGPPVAAAAEPSLAGDGSTGASVNGSSRAASSACAEAGGGQEEGGGHACPGRASSVHGDEDGECCVSVMPEAVEPDGCAVAVANLYAAAEGQDAGTPRRSRDELVPVSPRWHSRYRGVGATGPENAADGDGCHADPCSVCSEAPPDFQNHLASSAVSFSASVRESPIELPSPNSFDPGFEHCCAWYFSRKGEFALGSLGLAAGARGAWLIFLFHVLCTSF